MSSRSLESFFSIENLPCEEELISKFTSEKPLISILCTCYNHAEYISDAIKGFLIQKTYYPFEIIVHDDCSSDESRSIISSYQERYPRLIKTIFQTKNVYQKDKQSPLRNCLNLAKGDYIALCDGDDFWFHEDKLQAQMSLLLDSSDYAMVVGPGLMGSGNPDEARLHCNYGNEILWITDTDAVLCKGGQFAPTASYLLKRVVLDFIYDDRYSEVSVTDIFIELHALRLGGIIYKPGATSYYRLATAESWSYRMKIGGSRSLLEYFNALCRLIEKDRYLSELDWSFKKSYLFSGISLAFLREGNYKEFKNYADRSRKEKKIAGVKFSLFYIASRFPFILRLVMKVVRS